MVKAKANSEKEKGKEDPQKGKAKEALERIHCGRIPAPATTVKDARAKVAAKEARKAKEWPSVVVKVLAKARARTPSFKDNKLLLRMERIPRRHFMPIQSRTSRPLPPKALLVVRHVAADGIPQRIALLNCVRRNQYVWFPPTVQPWTLALQYLAHH